MSRHVRVNHQDVDHNDLRLREVLAQRLESGSMGRRRRNQVVDHYDPKPVDSLAQPLELGDMGPRPRNQMLLENGTL